MGHLDVSIVNLENKVVVVTGGAQGIGRAIVTDCATAGADVVIADIALDAAKQTAGEISAASGRRVIAIETDITDGASVANLRSSIAETFGRVDVLVNNAGWDKFAFFMDTTPEFWDRIIDINYKGALHMCHAMIPLMRENGGGSIVSIASDAGRGGSMGESVYAGCKGAIIAFSKTLAREHARDNIRVNVVAPGITDTNILDGFKADKTGEKIISAIAKTVPLGRRAGQPDEISPAVVFLASEAARFITGQVLSVNGGLTMVD